MCGSKKRTDAIEPVRTSRKSQSAQLSSTSTANLQSNTFTTNTTGSTSHSSLSSSASLAGIKASLPENPHIYAFSEISAATGNFLRDRFSSSTTASSWRCSLRGTDAVVFQRKLRRRIDAAEIVVRLAAICRSHHTSLVKLLGASLSGSYVYLAYEFVGGVSLAECLRNPRNPSFTALSTWLSRMKIAADLAHGLDYVHHCSGLDSCFVHNHITSSGIVVEEGSLSAKLCHFGTAELCGETETENGGGGDSPPQRRKTRATKVEGTRGYMSPELQVSGIPTQKCDVFAFGVVVLELLSGAEPLKYRLEEGSECAYQRVSVVDTARGALEGEELRKWIDWRVRDSYPVDVAKTMVRVGLDCVEEDPEKRPDMGRVAVMVSKLYLESKNWQEGIAMPTDISVSLAPR